MGNNETENRNDSFDNASFKEVKIKTSITNCSIDLHEVRHVRDLFWDEEAFVAGVYPSDYKDYQTSMRLDEFGERSGFEGKTREFRRKVNKLLEIGDMSMIIMDNGERHFVVGRANEIAKQIMDLGRKLIFPPLVYLEDGTKKEKYEEGDLAWYDTREWYAFEPED